MAKAIDAWLSPAEQARVVEAIQAAERRTSGEVRVHVEGSCPGADPYARATALFARLGLTRTRERNGVLIYVATRDHLFAVIGDTGIHREVGADFWQEAAAGMSSAFARGAFGEGLSTAIAAIGERLATRFPRRADDLNELSDEISSATEPEDERP